jgi:autotransporter translocation and assembly factor TamB
LKKSLKHLLIFFLILFLILGTLVSLGIWALRSPVGIRALLKTVSVMTPLKIDAREISGRLMDEVKIRDLTVRWPQGELRSDGFHLRWQAKELWNRRLLVHELSLDSVQVKDNRPETGPFSFRGWPETPFWLSRLQGQVDSLRIQRGTYQRLRENPVPFDSLFTRLHWDGETLNVRDFSLAGPSIQAGGSMKLGLSRPSLGLDLETILAGEIAGLDSFLIKLGLEPVPAQEEAKGSFSLSARRKAMEQLYIEGNLGLTRSALRLQDVRLLQPGGKGRIQGDGEIAFAEKPVISLKADFSGIAPVPELELLSNLQGIIEIKGPLDNYRGRLTVANQAKGWQKAQASAVFRGNLKNLEITTLMGRWLDGSVKGPLRLSWAEGFSLQGNLQGRKLNPGLLTPDVIGEINLNLDGHLLWAKTGEPEAVFKANFLESRLYDKSLAGALEGRWKENLLHIAHLRLRGPGFDLQGKGTLQEKITLEGEVTDLSRLIPRAKGQISAGGWFRYQEDRLSGMISAKGQELGTQGVKVGDFHADFQLKEYGPGISPVLSLEARALNIKTSPLDLSSISLQAAGSPASHRVQFDLSLNRVHVRGDATGAYRDGSWRGILEKLDGREDRGPWNLQGPAQVALSADRFRVSPLVIKSGQGESLEAQADLTLNPVFGSLQTKWQNLDLARVNPWIPAGRVSGQSSGSFSARGQEGGWQISGISRFKGTFAHERMSIDVPSGQVQVDWNGEGLLAATSLKLNQGATLDGKVSSPEAFQFDFPRQGKLEVQWKDLDLGLFHSLLPGELILKGKNSGTLAGRWFPGSRFEAAGKTLVSKAEFHWKGSPNPISIPLNAAEAEFAWRGEAIQGNLNLASVEHGTLKGIFLLPLSARFSPSFAPEGPLEISVQGQLQENGILSRLYPEWIQKSRGKAALELNAEGTWAKPQLKGTVQISDAGFQIDSSKGNGKAGKVSSGMNFEVPHAKAVAEWGPRGFLAVLAAVVNRNGRIEGAFTSAEPPRLALPRQGKVDLLWTAFNLAVLQPLLPEGFLLEGEAEGKMKGALLPEYRLDLAGGWKVPRGNLSWRGDKGVISAGISQAGLDFIWREERIQGNISLSLLDYGSLKGNFRLPLPARIPSRFEPAGPLQVFLQGKAQEKGLLSAFFPGMVEETRGNIDLDFKADGTWEQPNLQGTLQLTNAGANVPALGIRVEDLSSRWKFENERIQVESLRARSGPGYVEGTGTIWLKRWGMDRFEGNLRGEKFQTFYLPNLRIQSSPKLEFQGTPQKITVRGEIVLPEVHVYEVSTLGVAGTSSDVVMIDRPPDPISSLPMDIQVRVILGDQIRVKSGGIETRLAGNLDVKISGLKSEDATARGEIRLTQGTYGGYGLALRIDRGRFIYSGGPVDNPALDILALRRSDDLEKMYNIKVGVAIFGNLKKPNVKLYSQPAMKDEQILSYLFLGRPYDPKEGNLSLLLAGAGGLLAGDSIGVVDQLKSQLGIDTVDIQSGGGDLTRSMVSVGKYLTPQLYISYGYSVLSDQQLLKVRYRISKNWEVETWAGNEMGVDLYYRIDFY